MTDARLLLREYHEMQWYREQFQYRLMQLTDFLDRHGRTDEVIAILDDVGHEFPRLESLSMAKGRRAEKDGKIDLAIQHFEAAILASPNNPRVYLEFGEFFIRHGENQRAVAELDKCLELSPLQWWIIKRRGAAHFKLGNFQNSLDDLTRATEINPADVSTLYWIPVEDVAICPSLEFRDGMLKLADRCVELNQESAASLVARYQLLVGLGALDLDKARVDLQKISAQDPGGYYQQYQTALLSLRLEDSDCYKSTCQEILETTAETDPPNAKHFAAWTCVLAKNALADYTSAVTFARAAVEAEPENPQFRNGLGAILMRAELYTEAKTALEKALAADEAASTSKTYVRYFLAMTEHHLGNADAARLHLTTGNALADAEVSRSIPSNRRLTIELLRKEAQTLLGDAK